MPAPGRSASATGAWPQPSKSPMTATRAALGAHTAKRVPALPPSVPRVRAELVVDPAVRALGEEVDVDGAEAVAALGVGRIGRGAHGAARVYLIGARDRGRL